MTSPPAYIFNKGGWRTTPFAAGRCTPDCLSVVGTSRLELLTSSVSRKRSSHLSYAPVLKGRSLFIVSQPSRQAFFSQL